MGVVSSRCPLAQTFRMGIGPGLPDAKMSGRILQRKIRFLREEIMPTPSSPYLSLKKITKTLTNPPPKTKIIVN